MDLEAEELIDAPAGARVFALELRPLLGDCAPSGRIRLDGLARFCQDVAYADVLDAGIADQGFWVLRRTRLVVARFPRFARRYRVATFCSGIGQMWAQRRTTVTAVDDDDDNGAGAGQRAGTSGQPLVQAVALWVHLHPTRRVPVALSDDELAVFGAAARANMVSRQLRHPRPQNTTELGEWTFRLTDCDVADHVNNAAYWQPVEQELLARERNAGEIVRAIDAEVEFRRPAQPGHKLILADGRRRWLVEPPAPAEPLAAQVAPSSGPAGDGAEPGTVYCSTVFRNIATTTGSN